VKRLLLLRHAKSDWRAASAGDRERPLAPRGIAAAGAMGRYLEGIGQVPDLVLTSTAVRAAETARLAAEAGEWSCPVEDSDELYETTPEAVLELVREADDTLASLLLVGHEPTSSLLVSLLIGGGALKFPTAAMARVDCDISTWRDLDEGCGILAWLATPKTVGDR